MKKWKRILLLVALSLSVGLNIFLFRTVVMWQEAWLEQKLTTVHVERLLRTSNGDITFDGIRRQMEIEFGNIRKIETTVPHEVFGGAYEYSLFYDGTEFLFTKEELYAGTLPNLPENLLKKGIWFRWQRDY